MKKLLIKPFFLKKKILFLQCKNDATERWVSVNYTVAVRKFECRNLVSVNPNQRAVRMLSCCSNTVSSYMCQFSAEFNLALMMKKSLYSHSPVKSNFGQSK